MDSDHEHSDNDDNSYMEEEEEDDSLEITEQNHNMFEAQQNFAAVFDSRYGGVHPRFFQGTLRDAIDESFGISSKCPVMERRPFAIYLHNDDSVAANIFAQNVLCSETASALLNCQYVLWAWDVTQEDNRNKFRDWVTELGLTEVGDQIRMHVKEDYPLLMLITKDRSTYSVVHFCQGFDNPTDCVEKIMQTLDSYQLIKNKEQAEETSRREREQIRQEQVDAYEQSKAIDRARQQEQERIRQNEIAEQQRIVEEEERRQQRMATLASSLPVEPSSTDCITIRIRFPSGEQKIRRFNKTDQLKWLMTFVESLGYDMSSHRIWNSDIPKRDLSQFDSSKSFTDLNWPLREQVTVEEK
ncbi:unnamed protein product [Bursaphelenchus okinawaensis]|uniref:UBX domain-containing protein n=1 Tax=Bursaphelenchus okinawaensis TaxID=465554 RepID=A0A811K3P2_9BILA|nr:unnamed protein product [Bursaphelenchus okinawaensis]CAG9091291.1 unnamed protein product [Bursaphelenchus okinawaensis]